MKHEFDYNQIVNLLLDGKYIPDDMILDLIYTHFQRFLREELVGEEPAENKKYFPSMRILLHQFREMLLPEYRAVIDELYRFEVNSDESNE